MFTLEIAGRAIAMTNADDPHARELFCSDDFKNDLRSLESEGRPLWDGIAPLDVRPASEDEIEAFEDALDLDADDGFAGEADEDENGEEDEDGIDVLFLVPVTTVEGTSGAIH